MKNSKYSKYIFSSLILTLFILNTKTYAANSCDSPEPNYSDESIDEIKKLASYAKKPNKNRVAKKPKPKNNGGYAELTDSDLGTYYDKSQESKLSALSFLGGVVEATATAAKQVETQQALSSSYDSSASKNSSSQQCRSPELVCGRSDGCASYRALPLCKE